MIPRKADNWKHITFRELEKTAIPDRKANTEFAEYCGWFGYKSMLKDKSLRTASCYLKFHMYLTSIKTRKRDRFKFNL